MIEWLGLLAGCLTTISFLPQVLRVWRTRSVDDISLGMYLLFVAGVALWLTYGLLSHALPVIVANGVTLVLSGSVLAMKLRYRRRG
ncbi:SemiSWEET transporter [Chromobacterium sp. IIBBL 290-4]|uniref:SemiSWEET transporter n=1 Tax=Chromobacterium sp. IIBBL 290-4 TaxID=2953890 RepID=UPI0020B81E2D|nr:SemiSWEET transporter [Chromobacterium sp. IIBBL 290-4]UTH72445.1 SemiSWEET transporter [Chromobacterium sp. IIBBL 290-4]